MTVYPVTEQTLYLAVDPGKTTGYSGWAPSSDAFFTAEIEGRHRFMAEFERTVALGWRIEVACERYTINAGTSVKSSQYDALYIIGALDWEAAKLGFPLRLQSVGEAKSFATDAKLHALDWWRATPGHHSNMATRHLVTYLAAVHPRGDGRTLFDRFPDGAA